MLLAVIGRFVTGLLTVMELAMIVRAILSWFPAADDTRFADFIYMITDIVVVPFQAWFERMGWFRNSPIDVGFFAAYMCLVLVQSVLRALL